MTSVQTARLAGHGFTVALPRQWEGRIYQRTAVEQPLRAGAPAGIDHPVMHLANFALPSARGDYGTGAVERMTATNVFVALVEFGADCLGTALFAPRGLPRVSPPQFNPNGLQRRIAGQAGFQHFFTAGGRPLCLYVVLGSQQQATALCAQVNLVLDSIEIAA